MKISTEITKKFFGPNSGNIKTFKYMQSFLVKITEELHGVYPQKNVDDLMAMEVHYILGILQNLETFYLLCSDIRDYVAANALCRTIVDKISILNFQYLFFKLKGRIRLYKSLNCNISFLKTLKALGTL